MNAGRVVDTLVGIGVAIIGVAILAVLVSKRAETPQVLQAAGGALAGILGSAFSSI